MNPLLALLPDLPEDLTGLSAEELSALTDQARDVVDRLTSRDAETIGDASMAQVIEAATAGVELISKLTVEDERRVAEDAEADQALAALRDQAAIDAEAEEETDAESADDGPNDEDDESETGDEQDADETEEQETETGAESEESAEAIAAAAARTAARPRLRTGARRNGAGRRSAGQAIEVPVAVTASAEGMGVAIGQPVSSMQDIVRGMVAKAGALRGSYHEGAEESKIPLFKFRSAYPEDRVLHREDQSGNYRKLEAVIGPEAITAAGICAPVTPMYDLAQVSIAARPVRDSLPTFNAVRGGVIFMAPPKLSAVSTAVGRVTNAQAVSGGTPAVKGCQTVACPSPTEVDVASIYHCIKSENLNARAFPERLEQFTELAMAAQARLAEEAILDAMVTASTAVTAGQAIGAVGDLVKHILTAAAGMRSRHRMGQDAPLHAWFPFWVIDLLLADQIRSTFDRFRTAADIAAALAERNVNITFHLDTPTTGTSQIYGAQSAGGLLDFPSAVQWILAPEGSFTFLDGGELDLGIVRDSTLNTTNEFTVFGETWENVFFNGVESYAVTSTLCDTGQTGNTVAIACAS